MRIDTESWFSSGHEFEDWASEHPLAQLTEKLRDSDINDTIDAAYDLALEARAYDYDLTAWTRTFVDEEGEPVAHMLINVVVGTKRITWCSWVIDDEGYEIDDYPAGVDSGERKGDYSWIFSDYKYDWSRQYDEY